MASQVSASLEKESSGNRDGGPMFPSKKELLNSSSYSKDSEVSNGSRDSESYHQSIMQTVTLSDGEDSDEREQDVSHEFQSPSPLSKLYQPGMTPLPLLPQQDQNGSYWAMMERYVGTDFSTDDGADGEGSNTSALTPGSLTALMDMSLLSEKSATRTPSKLETTTPKIYYDEWRGEGTPSSNDKSTRSNSSKNNDSEDSITKDMLGSTSPSKLSPSPIAPSQASPFSTFKNNSSHIALDETKVYLRRIQELQKALESATAKAEMESRRREAVEDECRELKSHLRHLSPLKTPVSKVSGGRPRTPMSDSLWERNKTLVKEVRFADQTCVELSSQKGALEKEVNHLREELQSFQEKNEVLQKEISQHAKSLGFAEAQRDSAKERILDLESELASTKEILSALETDRHALLSKWSDAEPHIQTPSKRADALLRIMEENDKALEHIKELTTRLDESESELDRTRLKHDATVESLQERLQQTREENISLKQELQQTCEEKDSIIESLNIKVRQAQDDFKKLQQNANREIASLESERNFLQKEIVVVKVQLNQEEMNCKALGQKLEYERESMRSEKDTLESQGLTLKEELRVKSEEVSRFEIELQYTESKLKSCQQELENLTMSNTRARESQLQVENDYKKCHAQLQEAQNEIASLRVDLSEEQRVNAVMKQSMTKLVNSDIVNAQQVAARKLQEDCDRLQQELKEAQAKHESALEKTSRSLEQVRGERDSAVSSNKQLLQELVDEKDKCSKMQMEIDDLSKVLKESLSSAEPDGFSPVPQNHTTPRRQQYIVDEGEDKISSERQDLAETFDSLAHSEITQPLGQSKTALLGTSFLSPSADTQRLAMSPVLKEDHDTGNSGAVNITRDLELMEEARKRGEPTSPSMSSIDGVSNLLNCTIMSIAETPDKASSPPRTPVITEDIATAMLTLEAERDEALNLLEELNTKLKEKQNEEENDELDREILLSKVKAHEEEIAKLLSALNEFESKLESTKDEAQKAEQERDLVSAEKLHFMTTCESLQREVDKLRKEKDDEVSTLIGDIYRTLEINNIEGSTEGILKNVADLKKQANDLKSSTAAISAAMHSVTEENNQLQRDLEEARKTKEDVVDLQSALQTAQDRHDSLASQLASAKNELEKVLTEYEACRSETAGILESLTKEASRVSELEFMLSQTHEETEAQKSLLAESLENAEQWKAERDTFKENLNQLDNVNEHLQQCENSLRRDLKEMKLEMGAKEKLITEMERDIARIPSLEAENESLSASIKVTEMNQSKNKELYLESREKLPQSKEEIKSLCDLVQKTEEKLRDTAAALTEEQETSIRLQDEKERMLLDFQGFQEDLAEFERLKGCLLSDDDYLVSSVASKQEAEIATAKADDVIRSTSESMKAVTSAFEEEINNLKLAVQAASREKDKLQQSQEESQKTIEAQSFELEQVESKRLRLKEYTKKLVVKCEEWEVYFEKQQRLVDNLRRSSDLWHHKAKELEQLFDTEEQIYRHQFTKWSKEREGFLVAQHHMDEELERLAKELECGSHKSVLVVD